VFGDRIVIVYHPLATTATGQRGVGKCINTVGGVKVSTCNARDACDQADINIANAQSFHRWGENEI